MYIPKNLHVILVAVTLLISAAAVEVRVLTGLNMRGQVNQPDYDQKVVLNSNNRFIYPSQQVPEYNVFNMYNDQYAATIFSTIEISWKWSRILISILYSSLKKDKTR